MRVPVAAAFACLTLAVAVSAAVSSCIGAVGIGDSCSTMNDCAQPTAQPSGLMVQVTCSLGRCHYECSSSSFCGLGSECVTVTGDAGVCTLPDESTCPCPAGLECGPDKLCHTACPTSTCSPTQTCMAGACIDNPFPDGGPGDTGTPDSSGPDTSGHGDSALPDTSLPDTGRDTGMGAGDASREGGERDGSGADGSGADGSGADGSGADGADE